MTEPGGKERRDAESYVNILLPSVPDAPRPEIVDRIVRALYAHSRTRAAIEAAGGGVEPRYVALSEVRGGPPPRGTPFYNETIGVLTVPAPAGGPSVVQSAIKDVAPPGTSVEGTIVERTQGGGVGK